MNRFKAVQLQISQAKLASEVVKLCSKMLELEPKHRWVQSLALDLRSRNRPVGRLPSQVSPSS
jgi:hypothetical protein